MKVLVINCGSSSIKYKLFDMPQKIAMAQGLIERIGENLGKVNHVVSPGQAKEKNVVFENKIADHGQGLEIVSDILTDKAIGVVGKRSEISAVGHRVVHGGEFFRNSTLINDEVLEKIRTVNPLAPIHNPINIKGIEVALKLFPEAHQVAVFDTAFHQTMPAYAFLYALPYDYYEKYHIRRYGFHGTSHKYVAGKAAELLNIPLANANLITIHLGSGCSMSAVRNGESIDTSMGMTPLPGLIMGTRSGDIDPSIWQHLVKTTRLTSDEIETVLNNQSGLRGICGENDMRNIHRKRREGDKMSQLAFDMFVYSTKKYIGAYKAVLGRVDAVVFTAGIGENDPEVRRACCEGLESIGLELNEKENSRDSSGSRAIHSRKSESAIFVIPTNEELEIAIQTVDVIGLDTKNVST